MHQPKTYKVIDFLNDLPRKRTASFTLSNVPFAYSRKLFVSWVVNMKGVKCGWGTECST